MDTTKRAKKIAKAIEKKAHHSNRELTGRERSLIQKKNGRAVKVVAQDYSEVAYGDWD